MDKPLEVTIKPELTDFSDFIDIVRGLVQTSGEVADTLHAAGNFAESSKLYKAVMKLETYVNPDGDKESETH